jgi:hypothetical protein
LPREYVSASLHDPPQFLVGILEMLRFAPESPLCLTKANDLTIASYAFCDLTQPLGFRSVSAITDTFRLCKI